MTIFEKISSIKKEAENLLESSRHRPLSETAIESKTCIKLCNELLKFLKNNDGEEEIDKPNQ